MRSNINCVLKDKVNQEVQIYKMIMDIDASLHPISLYYDLLIYAKYIIETEKLDAFQIIEGNLDSLLPFLKEEFSNIDLGLTVVKNFEKYKVYKLLKKIIFEDYEIGIYNDRVLNSYIEKEKRYLIISSYEIPYFPLSNVDIIIYKYHPLREFHNKVKDKIIGIKKEYYDLNNLKEIDFGKYAAIIFINDGPKYLDFKDWYNDLKYRRIKQIKNIFMVTKYKYISYYDNYFENVKSVMFDKDKAYINMNILPVFKGNNDKEEKNYLYEVDEKHNIISFLDDYKFNIKELSNVKDEDLSNIVKSNEVIKDISIYVTKEGVLNNRRRLGFSSYKNSSMDRRKVLRLVDSNKYLSERIKELDDEIFQKIDKMIVR